MLMFLACIVAGLAITIGGVVEVYLNPGQLLGLPWWMYPLMGLFFLGGLIGSK